MSVAEFKHIVKEVGNEEEEEIPFNEKSLFGKIMFIIEFPFSLAGLLTIPPVEEDKMESILICFYPLTSIVAFLYLNGSKYLLSFNSI